MDFQDKLQYSVNNKILIAIVFGIIILLNILSTQVFFRWDWTKGDQYSVSESTVNVLENLEDLVSVNVYFSDDLPPQLKTSEQYVKDMLAEYQAYGEGNFRYHFKEVETAVGKQEAQQSGVQEVRMTVYEGDQLTEKLAYFGVSVEYLSEVEAISFLQENSLRNLEYELTSRIVRLTQPKLKTVAFLQGHGEHGIGTNNPISTEVSRNDYNELVTNLRKTYQVRTIDFSKQQTLEDVDLLFVAGPQRDLSRRAIFEIDQYLLRGGNVVFMIDGVEHVPNTLSIRPLDTNLLSLLKPLGITVNTNLVLDSSNITEDFNLGNNQILRAFYPPYVRLLAENFSAHPTVKDINAVVMKFVSSLNVEEVEGLDTTRLINSSVTSWVQNGPEFQVIPNAIPQPTPELGGASVVVASVRGLLPRISGEEQVPVLEEWVKNEDNQYVLQTVPEDNNAEREVITSAVEEGSVVVFSDSDFVADQSLESYAPIVLVQNLADYFTYGDELISIRTKALSDAPIRELEPSDKTLMKFLGVLLIPLLFTAYGIFRLWIRRKEEKMISL